MANECGGLWVGQLKSCFRLMNKKCFY